MKNWREIIAGSYQNKTSLFALLLCLLLRSTVKESIIKFKLKFKFVNHSCKCFEIPLSK